MLRGLARIADIHQPVLRWLARLAKGKFGKFFCEFSKSCESGEFYSYKICYLCLKRPILSCTLESSRVARTRQTCRHLPCRVAQTRQTRRHSPSRVARTRHTRRHTPSHVARTRQTRRHSPKAILDKNVTRLDKFARVMCESREFGASGHSLVLILFWDIKLIKFKIICGKLHE